MLKIIFTLVFAFAVAQAASTESRLEDFHKNPKKFYTRHIPKYDSAGRRVKDFPLRTKDVTRVQRLKQSYRSKFFQPVVKVQKFTAPPLDNDLAKNMVDGGKPIENIYQIEMRGLQKATLPHSPWSGDYWPYYRGLLGDRYLDSEFPESPDWKTNFSYVQENGFMKIFATGVAESINTLAVSEKYDLLVGDIDGTFTRRMWEQGQEFYDLDGKVEAWMGICHGWTAAAVMLPRPNHTVEALAYDGKTKIAFKPSELKGLLSYLWANANFPSRFVGGRCNYKDAKKDENGRPLNPECFDTNPATWFVAAVNQIGVSHRGFVMDATADFEVWNQPVYSYSFTYFNPQTLKPAKRANDAIVRKVEYSKDKFSKYRSLQSTHIVGIEMTVQYIVEERANDSDTDNEANDNIHSVTYLFDLELDEAGKILGGEWYQAEHPDFIWAPDVNALAVVHEDAYLKSNEWDGSATLPALWREAGKSASRRAEALSSVLYKLLERAQ